MFVQIIYSTWNFLLKSLLIVLVIAVVCIGAAFLFMQTNWAKHAIAERIEGSFNGYYQGNISVGKLDGLLPFSLTFTDIELTYDEDGKTDTLLRMDAVTVNPALWDLLLNKIRVNNLVIENPSLFLKADGDSVYTIAHALAPRFERMEGGRSLFRDDRFIDVFAPAFTITSGRIHADRLLNLPAGVTLPQPFSAYGIDLTMLLEVTETQKYLDVDSFTMDVPGIKASPVRLSGQIYNDGDYLELNRIHLSANRSSVIVNSLIRGVNLNRGDLPGQFEKAGFDSEIFSSFLYPNEFSDILSAIPDIDLPVQVSGEAGGFADNISFQDVHLISGESRFGLSGEVSGLVGPLPLAYKAEIGEFSLRNEDIDVLAQSFFDTSFQDWEMLDLKGDIFGDADSLGVHLDLLLPQGDMNLNAWFGLKAPWNYSGSLLSNDINAGQFPSLELKSSGITLNAVFHGSGYDPETARFSMDLDLIDSYYDYFVFPDLQVNLNYQDMVLRPDFVFKQGITMIQGQGRVDFSRREPRYDFSGEASLLDLADFTNYDTAPATSLNFMYDFNARGDHIDSLYGRANLDILQSVVNGDTLQPHQLYMDIDQPGNGNRTLRFTSSFMDMFIEGDVHPGKIFSAGKHWSGYFQDRITEEFMLDTLSTRQAPPYSDQNLNLNFTLELKDLELIKQYFPDLPLIASNANINFNVNADSSAFLISGGWTDNHAVINGYSFEDPDVKFTAHFRHGQKLRDFSSLDIEAGIRRTEIRNLPFNELKTVISMREDTIRASQQIGDFGNDAMFATEVVGVLDSLSITALITRFQLGNSGYFWMNEHEPVITYNADNSLTIGDATFENADQHIDVQGTYSPSLEDSVIYSLRNIDLTKISDLVDGRIDFQGILNAEFFTKSLAEQPSFQGDIVVDRFAIDNRTVGDIDLTSRFNADTRRFDTRLAILTDTSKYATYLAGNNNVGQDIVLEGFISPQDTLYYFDAYFNEIDLWVVPYIATGVFETVEGRGTGEGLLTGSLDDFYFNADLYAHEAYVKPFFFNTDYNISGHVELDRHNGVILDTLAVRDLARGTGRLYGQIAFNDFQPEKPLDITLELNSLAFLNNNYEPESYFYGNVGGTGVVNISGTNHSPYVRTTEPVRTTSQSRLSLPLLDETRVETQGRSVQFVTDFNDIEKRRGDSSVSEITRRLDREFAEVFQLDLQFIVSDDNIMQLVFDPVTGEVMNAEGSGRIRITLEDEEFQMFGGFDIDSGEYQFVGGDIFTRRFTLREGGTIRWDGDPVNARLNITAVYSSRPNINALLTQSPDGDAQRLPVDLLLDVTGTIENIVNDFYFEFPGSVDATQNDAILALLNSEEQKLLQATSLLFTGGFIPVGSGANQTQEFSSHMQSRTAQVGLSHLLSSQINTLLNSNLSNLDIDFNMSGFDQADLGIALRLFDDRLVLRRDGQVAGAQADIGDVGAKYQISNALSVELFHRKDPALIPYGGTQTALESVNGVGLEAQMQFNTWKQFRQRIWGAVTGLFGRKEDDEEEI